MGRLTPLLVLVLAIGGGACATRSAGAPVPRPFPGAALPPSATEPANVVSPAALPALISTALSFRGVPYRNGGIDPTGFDCSGFVQYVYAQHGLALPREVRTQYLVGREIDRDDVQAGDLIFFETVTRGASHVGMAIGGDQFVHAPSSTGVVRVERFTSSYWGPRFVGARRVTASATTPATTSSSGRGVPPGSARSSR